MKRTLVAVAHDAAEIATAAVMASVVPALLATSLLAACSDDAADPDLCSLIVEKRGDRVIAVVYLLRVAGMVNA